MRTGLTCTVILGGPAAGLSAVPSETTQPNPIANQTTAAVHYLDFKGRVTRSSAKNFQLVHWDHNSGATGHMAMQFGKRGGEEFVVDFAWPLSALQAFAMGECV